MQINFRVNEELLKILDSFIQEKKEETGINIARNTLINAAIYKLIDVSALKNYETNRDFVNFESYRYDFLNYSETKKLIEDMVNAKAELVIKRFKESNYLSENGLHTSAILALPVVEFLDGEYRIEEKILRLAIHQIIDLDGDVDGPKNLIFRKVISELLEESQNINKEDGYYYFSK